MRKIAVAAGMSFGILVSSLSADILKTHLSHMVHEKDATPGMVDLSRLDMPIGGPVKSRSSHAVIATVDGYKIRKKEADAYIKSRTKGKITDFDALPKDQQLRLVRELSLPLLMASQAKKELSEQEKEGAYVSAWIRKQAAKVTVTDAEVQMLYNQLKQKAMERNATNTILPPFESVKNKMKSQILEKKIMDGLMKDVKIEVAAPTALPPMMIRKP
ncbi:hypothetical protein YH65_03030 [Sulfurovum lithotrophicum]|uniref:Peptidylprolyl isomerase n=1 Tax=Sulfurovum lithotrophicum TaxID=206403 RepID=A0A7U4RQ42_9BACT|nr:hypothetical protein [Sulfurovum lithotrophicum]AKF24478.1 hypothetical protein YH65_03030 [Sulfurovum lithotrophicum]